MNKKAAENTYCSSVCKAWCCKYIVVSYDPDENNKPYDDEQLFRLRGITVNHKDHTLIIPCKCAWLNNHNKCKLYPWRPESCKQFRCEELNRYAALVKA